MAKILLAEDDMAVRDFVRRALELDAHDVICAHDGGEAAQVLDSAVHDFDLILADIKMPVMDGIALALKAARDWPDIPIILMTGFADQRVRTHGLDSLIEEVIAKPFTLEQITAAVSRVLGQAPAGVAARPATGRRD